MLLWQQSTKDIDDLPEQSSLIMTEVRGITMLGCNYREWRQLKSSAMPMPAFMIRMENLRPQKWPGTSWKQCDRGISGSSCTSLKGCRNLTFSSTTLGNITTLEYLDISSCINVTELPQVEHQQSLKELHMAGANLKELPSWIGNLCTLEALAIVGYSLEVLPPFSLTYLKNLKILLRREPTRLQYLPHHVLLEEEPAWKRCRKIEELNKLESLHDNDNDKCLSVFNKLSLLATKSDAINYPVHVCPNLQSLPFPVHTFSMFFQNFNV